VEASVAIKGTFSKWEATLTFKNTDISTGQLDIKIEADSVDTGSGMKNNKLKSDDFFNVEKDPYITFKSTKIVQTGPETFEVDGDFTIRGVTKQEKLLLTVSGKGTGAGTISGTMAFDRKEYGMNSGIPFIKIANQRTTRGVEVARKPGDEDAKKLGLAAPVPPLRDRPRWERRERKYRVAAVGMTARATQDGRVKRPLQAQEEFRAGGKTQDAPTPRLA
jgi:polyisoprenoid-binding protein YceI